MNFEAGPKPAAEITRAASKQTYYIVRFLADRDLVADAYRAYAYFRWVDDRLDLETPESSERIAFVNRQKALMDCCFRGEWPEDASIEEHMLVSLIRGDREKHSRLQSYIRNMMAVMEFDADRRGRLISQEELTRYSRHLAIAVTEALHYFIGNGHPTPRSEARYLAATGAHITHMLRDTLEDNANGYFNIPREIIENFEITPWDVGCKPYRLWVQSRVQMAKASFKAGKDYLSKVESFRCRIAGYAYIARFEGILDTIEQEGYRLRFEYPERRNLEAGLGLIWSAAWQATKCRPDKSLSCALPAK